MKRFLNRLKRRLLPLLDLSTWVLLVISAVPLYFLAPAMLITLAQWTAYGMTLAGIAVVLCRMVLPQIDLTALARASWAGGPNALPSAIMFAAVVFLLATFFGGLVLWAKA